MTSSPQTETPSSDDITGHVKIQREGGVPIATGENFHTVYEFEHMMQ